MSKIVSANLTQRNARIYQKISKIRQKGWFSQDVNEMIEKKYGSEKQELIEELHQLQKKRDDIELEMKALAKRINSLKDD